MSSGGHAYDALGRILSGGGVQNIRRDFIRRGSVGTIGSLIHQRFPDISQAESDFLVNAIMESEKAANEMASLSPDQTLMPGQIPINSALFGNNPTANRYLYSATFTIYNAAGEVIDVRYGNIPSVDPLSPSELQAALDDVTRGFFRGTSPEIARTVNANPGYTTKWTLTAIQRSY